MEYLTKIIRYYLVNSFRLYIILTVVILLVHLIASILVDQFLGPEREAGIAEPAVLICGFILGVSAFAPSFRYLLSQGISRQRFIICSGVSLILVSIILAILVMIYYAVSLRAFYSHGFLTIFEGIYHNQNLLSLVVWEFAAILLLVVLGWLIRLIYYKSGRMTRAASVFSPVVLWIAITSLNSMTNGEFLYSLRKFLSTILGYTTTATLYPNPYIASLSFLVIVIIMYGAVFLLTRRAQVTI
jgi:hypothetical protein